MITRLTMQNFKAFQDETLELRRLNILSGLNSSGKSSLIQALRLLHEKEPLQHLGQVKSFVRHDSEKAILRCVADGEYETGLLINRSNECKPLGEIFAQIHTFPDRCVVSYISADRYGPRSTLPLRIEGEMQAATVGHEGEYIIDFLHRLDTSAFGYPETPKNLSVDGEQSLRLSIQAWMRKIAPGVQLDYAMDEHSDLGRIAWNNYRPAHVGFGLSYTLPIVASVLVHSAQLVSGDVPYVLLMIENPEAHLHPSGQTMMGQLLALATACGVQIVVETHSDHFLNGVRLAVKKQELSHEHVACYFFKTAGLVKKSADENLAQVEQIFIDQYGMMDYWPDGFFDEAEKSLLQLL